jgi:ketosteroid isomerase-like protein
MSLRIRMLRASAAVMLTVVPGVAVAAAGTGGGTNEDDQMVAAAKRTDRAIIAAYNDKKWDELRALYSEDAVLLPPNHDPVLGRDAIVEYISSVRDVAGKLDDGQEYLRVKASGNLVSLAVTFTANSGHVRMTDAELYQRQPDGSLVMAVEQFGFRERPVG